MESIRATAFVRASSLKVVRANDNPIEPVYFVATRVRRASARSAKVFTRYTQSLFTCGITSVMGHLWKHREVEVHKLIHMILGKVRWADVFQG